MRSNEVNDIELVAMMNAMTDAQERKEVCKGIRTVCADASKEVDEASGTFAVRVNFHTTEDRTIRTYDTGSFAGDTLNLLAELWEVEPPKNIEEARTFMARLNKAMADDTRDIYFYGMPYKDKFGESKEMQKFRRVTKIDRIRAEKGEQES